MVNSPLLEVHYLRTSFWARGALSTAVDGASLTVSPGRVLGIVGESGSGKSVTSMSVLRLLPTETTLVQAERIAFLGRDLQKLSTREMEAVRGKEIAMIFQEPGTALNPLMRVGEQVAETLRVHLKLSRRDARARAIELFREVGIPDPERRVDSYPHEMSGGQKQRVMIAMALSCDPKVLIADEPTTALDVTIQAQILRLIRQLCDERGMGVIFITHDLGVIAEVADDVAVMYRGKIVETATVLDLFRNAQHPYTKALLACKPRLESTVRRLPLVSDFMTSEETSDGVVFASAEREVRTSPRGRRFHKASECPSVTLMDGDAFTSESEQPLLDVQALSVHYPLKRGLLRRTYDVIRAADQVSFHVYRGQTLGLVGESGSGKTTTGRAILQLEPATSGRVLYDGIDVSTLRGAALKAWRKRVQIVFQDPYGSLNPRMRVRDALTEAMQVHGLGKNAADRLDRACALLEEVGLTSAHLPRFPHEFSGGQRQRIGIARALSVEPELIVCDESVSALDVSVQAQVLNLLKDLQERRGLTYVFISHDLSVVKFMADMMAVMQKGRIVEFGPSDLVYSQPEQVYTRELIASIPDDSIARIEERTHARAQREPLASHA